MPDNGRSNAPLAGGRHSENPTVLPDVQGEDAKAVREAFEPGHGAKTRVFAGRNPSPKRIEEYTYLRKCELFREAERQADAPRGGLPEAQYEQLAAQAFREVIADPETADLDERVAQEWAITSCLRMSRTRRLSA